MNVGYERNMRCDECKYCRDVYTSSPQVKIRGCYCEPYKGKWVTEIEKCPMQEGMKMAHWIYSHYALNTYKAKCSSCGYEEKICDDLECKNCPKCNAIMSAPYQKGGKE